MSSGKSIFITGGRRSAVNAATKTNARWAVPHRLNPNPHPHRHPDPHLEPNLPSELSALSKVDARNHYQRRYGSKLFQKWYDFLAWCKGEEAIQSGLALGMGLPNPNVPGKAVFEEEEEAYKASEEGTKYRHEV